MTPRLQLGLGLLLLALLLAWVSSRLEWVDEPTRQDPRGEAVNNPHHAVRLLIERLGYPTHKLTDPGELASLPVSATIVASGLQGEQIGRRVEAPLIEWVHRGGHLVLAVPSSGQSQRFTRRVGLQRVGHFPATLKSPLNLSLEDRTIMARMPGCDVFRTRHPVIWSARVGGYKPERIDGPDADDAESDDEERDEDVGADAGEDAANAARPADDSANNSVNDPADNAADQAADDTPGDATREKDGEPARNSALAVARWKLGQGLVTATCSSTFYNNAEIGKLQHAELAVRMMIVGDGHHTGPVVFIPRPRYPMLAEWLMINAWTVLSSLTVLLVLALWQTLPRFGPVLPEPPPNRPGLLQHLRAVASFHLRKKHFPKANPDSTSATEKR